MNHKDDDFLFNKQNTMVSEEIKNLIQALIKENLEGISGRINLMENELQNIKIKLFSKEQESQLQGSSIMNKINLLEASLQISQEKMSSAKSTANSILEKTQLKLKEQEILKKNQENALQNLQKQKAKTEVIQERSQQFSQPPFQIPQQQQPLQISSPPWNSQINNQNSRPDSQSNYQVVYKTACGKKYHSDGCEWLKNTKIPIERQQAIKEGLQPCLVCKP